MRLSRLYRIPRAYLLGFALATAVGLLLAGYRYLERVTAGRRPSLLPFLIDELGAAWLAAAFIPVVIVLVRRFPLDRPGRLRRLPVYMAGALAYAVFHTSGMWGTRCLLYPLAGLGAYDYGRMPVRYLMELPMQLIVFSVIVALVLMLGRYRAARQRELRISQLETQLVRARLDALRMQLNPHFLFNALNTVSAVMYEDVAAADEVLARLGELLRRTMHGTDEQEVPLHEELETLDLYAAIMRARFGDRLDLRVRADPTALDALVPSMLLQPLLENAIQHGGVDTEAGRLVVDVEVRAAGDRLRIEVRDSGRGARDDELRRGIGLGNTIERLGNLFGVEQRFEAGTLPGGGFGVCAEIPYRTADRHVRPSQELASRA